MSILLKIKDLCYEKGITITFLERELDFSKGSIGKWDVSSPSVEKLKKVAEYFNVPTDYLINTSVKGLNGAYFRIAKQAQDKGIPTEDIESAIDFIQRMKRREDEQ